MPLKDLLSKAPAPLPPSEEPWPKPPPQEDILPRVNKHSPLYSATSRPTVDEFLRTNYLMIPEFVTQVNRAKKAAGIGVSEQGVQQAASQQIAVNFGEGTSTTSTVFSAVRNQAVNSNINQAKAVENKEKTAQHSKLTAEMQKTKTGDTLSGLFSQKRIPSDEIQVPPPLKPKPRIKKVMKGGSLVTIPAPQPRNRTVHSASGSTESGGKTATPSVGVGPVDKREEGESLKEPSNNQVMKGGSLVTTPAPQPRNRTVHSASGSAESGGKTTTPSVGVGPVDKREEGELSLKEPSNNQVMKGGSLVTTPAPQPRNRTVHSASGSAESGSNTTTPSVGVGPVDKREEGEISLKEPSNNQVMKGGSLVTIPAPQPRNRTVHSASGSTESGRKTTTPSVGVGPVDKREEGESLKEPSNNQVMKGGSLVTTPAPQPRIRTVHSASGSAESGGKTTTPSVGVGPVDKREGESLKEPSNNQVMKGGSFVTTPAPQPRIRTVHSASGSAESGGNTTTPSVGVGPVDKREEGEISLKEPSNNQVMKGGSLVTIYAPQPRNRTVHSVSGKTTTPSVTSVGSEGGERVSLKESVNKASVKCQSGAKGDSSQDDAGYLQKEVRTTSAKQLHLRSEVLPENCEQKEVSLTSSCNTDILQQSKDSKAESLLDSLLDPGSNPSRTKASTKDEESDISLQGRDHQVIINKDSGGVCDKGPKEECIKDSEQTSFELMRTAAKVPVEKMKKELFDEPTCAPERNIVSKAFVKEPDRHLEEKSPIFITDLKAIKINEDVVGESMKGLGSNPVSSNLAAMEKSVDLAHDVVVKMANEGVGPVDEREGESLEEPSNNQESHDEDERHSDTEVGNCEITGIIDDKDGCGNDDDDFKEVNVAGCDVTMTVDDGKDRKSDDGSLVGNNDGDSSEDDDDDNDDKDKGGGDKPIAEESDDEYAELIMEDSNSEEEEEGDFIPGNNDDSDEEEGEVKSDYELEDMKLDSDTEKSTGGITFYQDTTLRKRKNCSWSRQRKNRKAKKQRKKASKKNANAEKKAATEKSTSFNPSRKTTNIKEMHMHVTTSQKPAAKDRPKNQVPDTQKSTETLPKPQADTTAPGNKPADQTTLEEGSLLSMVSSYAVDVTVAASEKLALKTSRGGQHAKKLKKKKRKAAALERIRKGEPPLRPIRVPLPKPICNYYIHGKCRMGVGECSFRHDKSAIVRKRELCKFYVSNSCFLGDDCPYMHNSFPCKYFHTGSTCWVGDRCKFSHDALTEETSRLLHFLFLDPPAKDPVQLAPDKNAATVDNGTPGNSQPIAGNEDPQTSASSPYNLRTSTRKRRLSTDGGGHATGEKTLRLENACEEANSTGQASSFFPGLYKDLSI